MTLALDAAEEELDELVSQLFVTSVCEILETRAVNVLSVKASTLNVALWPMRMLPMSVSSTFALICFFERSAMRMMTVGLSDPCTAIVPAFFGSPTTTPEIGAVMIVSFASEFASSSVDCAVS